MLGRNVKNGHSVTNNTSDNITSNKVPKPGEGTIKGNEYKSGKDQAPRGNVPENNGIPKPGEGTIKGNEYKSGKDPAPKGNVPKDTKTDENNSGQSDEEHHGYLNRLLGRVTPSDKQSEGNVSYHGKVKTSSGDQLTNIGSQMSMFGASIGALGSLGLFGKKNIKGSQRLGNKLNKFGQIGGMLGQIMNMSTNRTPMEMNAVENGVTREDPMAELNNTSPVSNVANLNAPTPTSNNGNTAQSSDGNSQNGSSNSNININVTFTNDTNLPQMKSSDQNKFFEMLGNTLKSIPLSDKQ